MNKRIMRITAPSGWLDDVDVEALRQWFLDHGFRTLSSINPAKSADVLVNDGIGTNLMSFTFPVDIKRLSDWRQRVMERIEWAADIQGITAAEWFQRNMVTT